MFVHPVAVIHKRSIFFVIIQLGDILPGLLLRDDLAVRGPMLLQFTGAGVDAAQAVCCGRGLFLCGFHCADGGVLRGNRNHIRQNFLSCFQFLNVFIQRHFTRSCFNSVIS